MSRVLTFTYKDMCGWRAGPVGSLFTASGRSKSLSDQPAQVWMVVINAPKASGNVSGNSLAILSSKALAPWPLDSSTMFAKIRLPPTNTRLSNLFKPSRTAFVAGNSESGCEVAGVSFDAGKRCFKILPLNAKASFSFGSGIPSTNFCSSWMQEATMIASTCPAKDRLLMT